MAQANTRATKTLTVQALSCALVGILTWGCGSAQSPAQQANVVYQVGQQAQADGDLETARLSYRQSLEHNPKLVDARYNLAVVLQALGRDAEALTEIKEVIKLNDSLVGAHLLASELHMATGDAAGALSEADSVLATDPQHSNALRARAVALIELRRFAEAVAAYEAIPNRGQGDFELAAPFAKALAGLGEGQKAIDVLRLFAGSHAEDPMLHLGLGRAHFAIGKYDEAREALIKSTGLDPNNAEAQLLLGQSYMRRGQEPLGLIALQKSVELNPNSAESQAALGAADLKRGYADRATGYATKALELDANSPAAHALWGQIHAKAGAADKAEQSLRKSLELDPHGGDVAERLAKVLIGAGKTKDAAAVLLPFASAPQAPSKLVAMTADALEASGDNAAAIKLLASASKRHSRLRLRAVTLAVANPKAGLDGPTLVALAQKLHEDTPGGSLTSLLLLADALVANDERDKAVALLKSEKARYRKDKTFKAKLKALK